MRGQGRRTRREEEAESAFISMTDMTVGFLFIMMILLAYFASRTGNQNVVPREEHLIVVKERNDWQVIAQWRGERIEKLTAEREELLAEIALLRTEKTTLERQFEELQKEHDRLKEDHARLRVEVADLQLELDALRLRLAALLRQIEQKDTRISELEARVEELEAELAKLKQIDPLEEYLSKVARTRREVLVRLRDAIKKDFPNLQVELSEESDALRFQGEGLFATGQSTLTPQKRNIVERLALRLDEVLPCYTIGPRSEFSLSCNGDFVMIEAVQIEGHTDNVGPDQVNRALSSDRANSTFSTMTKAADGVMAHKNLKGQPVLSIAAYGSDRPVATNQTAPGRATNRRIDLRFIMVTPRAADAIDGIRKALVGVMAVQ